MSGIWLFQRGTQCRASAGSRAMSIVSGMRTPAAFSLLFSFFHSFSILGRVWSFCGVPSSAGFCSIEQRCRQRSTELSSAFFTRLPALGSRNVGIDMNYPSLVGEQRWMSLSSALAWPFDSSGQGTSICRVHNIGDNSEDAPALGGPLAGLRALLAGWRAGLAASWC